MEYLKMIAGELKSRVDKLWNDFWSGGIANPLTVIEQMTYLMFLRLLDIRETNAKKQWERLNPGKPFKGTFGPDEQNLRWCHFKEFGDGDEMLVFVRDKVFPHLRKTGGPFLKDAQLLIPKGSLLVTAVEMIDKFPLAGGDTKGGLYEYVLSHLTTAGINGQFRTPRHIIRMMVEVVLGETSNREELTWTVADPACGTGGFLVSVMQYLMEKYTSEKGKIVELVNGDKNITFSGDLLNKEERRHMRTGMFHGFDFDATMLRIAAMNLMLHGVDQPSIHYQDTLSNSFPDRFPNFASDAFDLVLANPPFKGSLDYSDVHPSLTSKVKTKKTELLFIVLLLRMLKLGGRCGVIVPDGVLFGSSNAHVELRKMLVEEHQLEAVIKLPAGVFKPYAGVSTAVLVFTRGGKTGNVWFCDVQSDGFTLDDKRQKIGAEDDFQDVSEVPGRWAKRNPKTDTDRTDKAFFVPKQDIVEQSYDLSLNRYKEVVHADVKYDPPKSILRRLKTLEKDIASELQELEAML